MYPVFHTVFAFVRKYEFDREKVEIGVEQNGMYLVCFQPYSHQSDNYGFVQWVDP
jgi:hypothetical protein